MPAKKIANEEPSAPPPPTETSKSNVTPMRRAGSARTRLAAVTEAVRPKMNARAMISGPSGAGKTWTMLSIASTLAPPVDENGAKTILVIDTEKESALTYADNFVFLHLPWRPPFDPGELAEVLDAVPHDWPAVQVVIVDSFSHFWRGQGGTLEIADSRFAGWKDARPVQLGIVDAILSMPTHVLLGCRSKMDYIVSERGKEVTKIGLAPIQDETLVYEMNVAMDLDMEHRITVIKSRTPAVPVGRMYPAGLERKAAEDYAEWLAGGVPPAPAAEVDALKARLNDVMHGLGPARKDEQTAFKSEFVTTFGMPDSMTADQIGPANAWLDMMIEAFSVDEPAEKTSDEPPGSISDAQTDETTDHAHEPDSDVLGLPGLVEHESSVVQLVETLKDLSSDELNAALKEAELSITGNIDVRRRRLAESIVSSVPTK